MDSTQIRELMVEALRGRTFVGDSVYPYRDWPTSVEMFPLLIVSAPFEKKQSLGRNAPQFHTVTTIRVMGRVIAYDDEDGNTGAEKANASIERLKLEVEKAVINYPPLQKVIQQFVSIESQTDVSSEGNGHTGQLFAHFHIEYYQGPDDFYPIEATPIHEIHITEKQPDGTPKTGLIINLK